MYVATVTVTLIVFDAKYNKCFLNVTVGVGQNQKTTGRIHLMYLYIFRIFHKCIFTSLFFFHKVYIQIQGGGGGIQLFGKTYVEKCKICTNKQRNKQKNRKKQKN